MLRFATHLRRFALAVVGSTAFSCAGSEPAPEPSSGTVSQGLFDLSLNPAPSTPVGALPGSASVGASGEAHYSIPIEVSPGVAGMQPELSIEYGSNADNGPLGLGMAMSGLSSISRCTKTIADDGAAAPIAYLPTDAICLDGERLVLASGVHAQAGATYRTRREPFSRITLDNDLHAFGGTITVHAKDGRVLTYGTDDAMLWLTETDSSRVPWRWAISKQCDRFDNCIDYDYEQGVDLGTGASELRLVEIRYAGTGTVAQARKVRLTWEARPDVIKQWFFGAQLQQAKRLRSITIEGNNGTRVRTYRFQYDIDSSSGYSRLVSAKLCDLADVCLPQTTFTWETPVSAAMSLHQWVNDPLDSGISDAEQQMALLESRHSVIGSFASGGDDGVVFQGNEDTGEFGLAWNGDEDVMYTASIHNFLPAGNDAVEADLDEMTGPFDTVPVGATVEQLHRFQPELGPTAIDFNGDILDDILIPEHDGWPYPGQMADAHGHAFARDFSIAMGGGADAGYQAFTIIHVDDGSNDPIYQMVPLDQNGDRFTDVWMCRGPGYKSGHWVLARHVASSTGHSFAFTDSGVACSAHDEYQVVSLHGGYQSLLVIPAYTPVPAEQPDPAAMSAHAYVVDFPPLPDDQRGDYMELRVDPATGAGALFQSGLPRDLYQRLHDGQCANGLIRQVYGGSLLGAGASQDRHIDLNNDGFADVLRFELAVGDDVGHLAEIASGLATDLWSAGNLCGSDAALQGPAVLRVYYNTGVGFIPGPVAIDLPGNAHANLWLNVVGSQLYDYNADGRVELLMPGHGPGTDWIALATNAAGSFITDDDLPFPTGWPAYIDDATWRDDLELSGKTRVLALDDGGDWPNLAFIGWVDNANWPYIVNMYRSLANQSSGRIASIADGMGVIDELEYRLEYDTDPNPTFPKAPERGGLWITEVHRHLINPQGDFLETRYSYDNAVSDRHGRGFLGFEAVESASALRRTRTTYDTSYDSTMHDYPRRGHPIKRVMITDVGDRDDVARDVWTWQTKTTTLAGGTAYFVFPAVHDEQRYTVNEGACDDVDCGSYNEIHSYREAKTTETRDAFGTLLTQVRTIGDVTATLTQASFVNNQVAWLIGLPKSTTVRSCRGITCETRTASSAYDPVTGARTKNTMLPGNTSLALETAFTYDEHGNIDTETRTGADGSIRVTTTQWDAEGVFPELSTDELGHETQHYYHRPSGALMATIAPDGTAERIFYDGLFRVVKRSKHDFVLNPDDGAPTTVAYALGASPGVALTVTSTTLNGQQVTEDYAPTGQLIERRWLGMSPVIGAIPHQIPAGELVYQRFHYDIRGFQTEASVPQWVPLDPSGWYVHEVDGLGRITKRVAPDGYVLETKAYQSLGTENQLRVASTTTKGVQPVTTSIDTAGDGLPVMSTDASGVVTQFTYGPFDQLKSVKVGTKVVSTITYDARGNVKSQVDPWVGARTSTWNSLGELVKHIDAKGSVTIYDYDLLGRLIQRSDGDGDTDLVYDVTHIGALRSTTSPDGVTTTYDVDSFGRVYLSSTVVPSSSGADTYVMRTDYGPGGRIAKVTFPAPDGEPASAVSYVYDAAGYQRAAKEFASGDLRYVVRTANPSGQPTLESYGNNVNTTRRYDEKRLWLTDIATSGATDFQRLHYTWLPQGELQERRDVLANPDQFEAFEYDNQWRLTKATVTNGTSVVTTQQYDDLGNLTNKSDLGAYSYDASGRLMAIGSLAVTHDATGNITKYGARTMAYTPSGQVRSIAQGGQTQAFLYDGSGGRVRRTDETGAQVITLGTDYERTLSAAGVTQSITRRITAGGRVVAQVISNKNGAGFLTGVQYMHDDQLGSTHIVTNSGGGLASAIAYDAWGRARNAGDWRAWATDADTTKPGIGFTGHRARLDSGLVDMGGRMYDPRVARFTSPDALNVEPLGTQGHGRYSYVGNRPLRYTDPSGWAAEPTSKPDSWGTMVQEGRIGEVMDLADQALRRACGSMLNGHEEVSDFIENMDAEHAQAVVFRYTGMSSLTFEEGLKAYVNLWTSPIRKTVTELKARVELVNEILAAVADDPAGFMAGVAVEMVEQTKADLATVSHAHGEALDAVMEGDFKRAMDIYAKASVAAENLASMVITGGGKRAAGVLAASGKSGLFKRLGKGGGAGLRGAGRIAGMEYHHLLPVRFAFKFWKRGLILDDYTIAFTAAEHKLIHAGFNRWNGGWNKQWKTWFDKHPDATKQDILDHMDDMRTEFGITDHPVVPYPK